VPDALILPPVAPLNVIRPDALHVTGTSKAKVLPTVLVPDPANVTVPAVTAREK
jgi:hypothetical protein